MQCDGTVVLSAANTYTGGTTIKAMTGTIAINGAAAVALTSGAQPPHSLCHARDEPLGRRQRRGGRDRGAADDLRRNRRPATQRRVYRDRACLAARRHPAYTIDPACTIDPTPSITPTSAMDGKPPAAVEAIRLPDLLEFRRGADMVPTWRRAN
jgi:hypothetical protein